MFNHTPEAASPTEPHSHTHEHQPVVSQTWKWTAALGNMAVGAFEIAVGKLDALSVTGDGVHNGGDALSYYLQADNEIKSGQLSPEKQYRRRKIGHTVIAACSGSVMAKAGFDIGLEHESHHNHLTLYAASASMALNGLLYARLHKGIKKAKGGAGRRKMTVTERDLTKHMVGVDIPSAMLAGCGAVMQRYGVEIPMEPLELLPAVGAVLPERVAAEQVAGVGSGALGVYLFRPTKKNLSEHNCPLHGGHDVHTDDCSPEGNHHGHGHENEHAHETAPQHPPKPLKWHEKLGAHAFATSLYVTERAKRRVKKSPAGNEADAQREARGWVRRTRLGMAAVAGAAIGAGIYHITKGGFMPELGLAESLQGGVASPELPPDAVPDSVPEAALPAPDMLIYSPEALSVSPGKSWSEIFEGVNIAAEHRQALLEEIGPDLAMMRYDNGTTVAYFEHFSGADAGEWRVNMPVDQQMPPEVLGYIKYEERLLGLA